MTLRKWSFAFVLMLAATLLSFPSVAATRGDADFTMTNRTGLTISEIYVSAVARNQWGRDRLGDGVLENTRSRHLKFGDSAACQQDIKLVFDNADEVVWSNVNLCELEKITLRYDRASKKISATAD